MADSMSPPAQPQMRSNAASLATDPVEARRLAAAAFAELAQAIKSKDYVPLYETMAPSFRHGASPQQVADGFRSFTDRGVDLTGADPRQLVVTPAPFVDGRGVFIVRGIQTVPAQTWHFEFGFLPDGQSWALTTLSLSSTGK